MSEINYNLSYIIICFKSFKKNVIKCVISILGILVPNVLSFISLFNLVKYINYTLNIK